MGPCKGSVRFSRTTLILKARLDPSHRTSLKRLPIIYSYRRPNVSHVHYGTNTTVAIHGPKTLKDVWYGGGANLLPDT